MIRAGTHVPRSALLSSAALIRAITAWASAKLIRNASAFPQIIDRCPSGIGGRRVNHIQQFPSSCRRWFWCSAKHRPALSLQSFVLIHPCIHFCKTRLRSFHVTCSETSVGIIHSLCASRESHTLHLS